MLVLRRKAGESVVLNGVIKITILGVEGDRVKIGIQAPPDVIVVRSELLDETGASTDQYGVRHMDGNYQPNFAGNGKAVS